MTTNPTIPASGDELSDERIDTLLSDIDDVIRQHDDHNEYGIPMWDETLAALRPVVREAVATIIAADRAARPATGVPELVRYNPTGKDLMSTADDDAWVRFNAVEVLRADAARYRQLRGGKPRTALPNRRHIGRIEVIQWESPQEANVLKGEALDAAVDSAIEAHAARAAAAPTDGVAK